MLSFLRLVVCETPVLSLDFHVFRLSLEYQYLSIHDTPQLELCSTEHLTTLK
jgi:hypothetical protein